MRTKYTPGPWSINDWPQKGNEITIGAVGTPRIAEVVLRDVSIVEQKANANLIATAPELLSCLEAFCMDHTNPCGCENCRIIRKAKGER